jgi:thioredoxin 1
MNLRKFSSRKQAAITCLCALAGSLPLAGCSFSRAVEDKFPAWVRSSQKSAAVVREVPTEQPVAMIPKTGPAEMLIASERARTVYPSPYPSMGPDGEQVAISDMRSSPLQSPQLSDQPIAEAPAATNTWSRGPQPSSPSVRLVSNEWAPPPVQPTTTPPSTGPRLELARAESLSNGKPALRTVLHASAATFDEQVLHSDVPVLVDFYASWCGPCKALAPTLEEVAAESPRARVVKVNIDDNPGLAARYGVKSIPNVVVFKDGRVVANQKGVLSKNRLKAMLDL